MSGQVGKLSSKSKRQWKVVFWPRKIQRPTIEIIIVDTAALIDTSKPLVQSYPHGTLSSQELLDAASHALVTASDVPLQHLRGALPPVREQPMATFTKPVTGSTWHHGRDHTTYWIGPADSLLHRCDLTENERERTLAQIRQLNAHGKLVYSVACESDQKVAATARDLTLMGLISTELRTHRDLHKAITFCREQNIRLVYASTDAETTVSAVAHATKLLEHGTLPSRFDLKYHRSTTPNSYAHLSTTTRQKLIEQFDASTTLVTNSPLTDIVKTITIR